MYGNRSANVFQADHAVICRTGVRVGGKVSNKGTGARC
jgi:hypothetical protein